MIDGRFSRDRFASIRDPVERRWLAGELADEIVRAIASAPTAEAAFSSVLARLRLLGHHLYPLGEGRFGGGLEEPTGLEVRFGRTGVEARWR